ncbi:MAG: KH domain-containing protein [Victivallales bacterium]|nr:KH domain-containing protein [Victivallales bacterium]
MIKKLFDTFMGKGKVGGESAPASAAGGDGIRDLEHFVDYVVRALVDQPDLVRIETVTGERGLVIQVVCATEDVGKIIGKNGKTISAIRALVSGAGRRFEKALTVEVKD